MIHEIGCLTEQLISRGYCTCEQLRAAYERGKQDARKHLDNLCCFCGTDHWSTYVCDSCIEEHNKLSYYYDVHMPECEDEHCGGCIPANSEDLE